MSSSGLQFVRQMFQLLKQGRGFDRTLDKLRILEGTGNGRCVCELTVDEDHQNRGGTLHGGLTATLVDTVSTAALMTTERQAPGVSVDMNISYIRAAKVGEDIVIDANTLKVGKSLAFLTVDIKNKEGKLVAQGRHTKYIGG